MSSTEMSHGTVTDASGRAVVGMRFESTTLPVADADRAKAFYEGLGWRLDADFDLGEKGRVIQFTPPCSPASIQFGRPTKMAPGSAEGLLLVVDDINAAREELISRGVDATDVWHALPGETPTPGRDPDGRSYVSFTSFADPDGNRWLVQEITTRAPGRE